MPTFTVTDEAVESAARALYYSHNHPGSVPGWTGDDAKKFQPYMGEVVADETLKRIYRQDARTILIAAGVL